MEKKERYLFGIRIAALVEIACFFIICLLIAYLVGIDFNFFSVSPHPFWIVVILISAQYGTLAGLLAAFVATIVYLAGPLPKQNILQEWSEYFFVIAKLPLLWFVSAIILGELRMKHIRERDHLRVIAYETEEREKKLAESYESLKRIKERLETRVAAEIPTNLIILDSIKKLEESEKKDIIPRAFNLIKVLIAPEKFSIFFRDSDGLKLEATEGWGTEERYAKNFVSTTPLYREIVERKRVLSLMNRDADTLVTEGMLATPILSSPSSEVIGMIKIEQIPFQQVKLGTIESLRLIGVSIGKAYENNRSRL